MTDSNFESAAPAYDALNLVVGNMDATVAFYRLLGLEIPDDAIWQDGAGAHVSVKFANGVDLDFDSPALAKAYNRGWDEDHAGSGRAVLNFRVQTRDAVDELFARLTAAGHRGSQPPFDAFWGSRYAVVCDPDGHPVGLKSVVDPAKRSSPPSL